MSSLVGRRFGSYELLALIARGGMGEVYRARHLRLSGREVAIKVLPTALALDPSFLQRFEREANSAASLNHPNILPLWEYGEQDGAPYIVMPLLTGGSLRERLRGQPLHASELLRYLEPVARALDYAHGRGIVHRDIKPANVLLDEAGGVFLADFGIAKAIQSEAMNLTRTGIGIGTPEYMAPEQAQGNADPRSDIYALGVIAYEGLAGRVPYRGNTPVDIAIQHMTAPLPPLSKVNPAIAPEVEAVVSRALSKASDDRPATAGGFVSNLATALMNVEAGRPTAAQPAPPTSVTMVPPPVAPTPMLPLAPPLVQQGVPGPPVPIPPPVAAVARPARIAAWPIALALAVGLLLGAGLTLLVLNLRGSTLVAGTGGQRGTGEASATATVAASATTTVSNLPYPFPVTNATLTANYQKSLAQAQKLGPDARLRSLKVSCYNPRSNAECRLRYSYFSKQTDQVYDYDLSFSQAAPDQKDQYAAGGDYDRIVFITLPWEKNANWSRLLSESYALLPSDFGRNGFQVDLEATGPDSNEDNYDWSVTYSDKDTNQTLNYIQRGTVVKLN